MSDPCGASAKVRSLDLAADFVVLYLQVAVLSAVIVASCGVLTSHPYIALGKTLALIIMALSSKVRGRICVLSTVAIAPLIRLSKVTE